MGIMECDRHGQVGFVDCCEHVHAQIDAGETPVGHRYELDAPVIICDQCFKTKGFDKMRELPRPPGDEYSDEVLDWGVAIEQEMMGPYAALENRRIHCVHCFEALGPKYLSIRLR